jgi:hypothetical protein
MWNADLEMAICKPEEDREGFYRDGEGDELIFACEGSGTVETVFGELPTESTTTWRSRAGPPTASSPTPGRRRGWSSTRRESWRPRTAIATATGQLLEHAPYSQRDFHPPQRVVAHREEGEYEVTVRVRGGHQRYVLDYHPLDVVGWDGYVYPYTFNIHDFEPRAGRFHLPPTVHQTFQGPNFVICSFCPRELDWDPTAVPIPYHHSNLQSEEVIYYVSGEFGSRRGVDVGAITVPPERPAPRPAAGPGGEVARRAPHRGAGGDVGHVQAAAPDPAGARARRSELRLFLARESRPRYDSGVAALLAIDHEELVIRRGRRSGIYTGDRRPLDDARPGARGLSHVALPRPDRGGP